MLSEEILKKVTEGWHADRVTQYCELRSSQRHWSHRAASAITFGIPYSLSIYSCWPLIYSKHASEWWRRRGGNENELNCIEPIFRRLNSDYHVLDGRDVVAHWIKLHGKFIQRRFKYCEKCDGSDGYVYVLCHKPFKQLIKIGKTNSVPTRVRGIAVQAGVTLDILGTVKVCCYKTAGSLEIRLHQFYDQFRWRGEWFKATSDSAHELGDKISKIYRGPSKIEKRYYRSIADLMEQRFSTELPIDLSFKKEKPDNLLPFFDDLYIRNGIYR